MLARFVLRLEPVASADLDTVVAWYAPTVQRYLTAPLADGDRTARGGSLGCDPGETKPDP